MIIHAFCKINIGLDVVERRPDGYHSLRTVIYPVRELHDTLLIEPTEGEGVDFSNSGIEVDCAPQDNICIKAYNLLRRDHPWIKGAKIALHKAIPFGAGLGGGSADGTATLLALNTIYKLGLTESQLTLLASELGSDTAFFVRSTPSLCTGRGEVISPIEIDLRGKHLLLVKPDVAISTREAYAGITPHHKTTPLEERVGGGIESWQGSVVNDFEPHIFAAHPLLARIKESLLDAGALYASMSGSGSTLFGIFDHEPHFTPPVEGLFIHHEQL